MTNLSVGPHDAFREVKAAVVRQHLLDCARHGVAILGVHERHVFRDGRRLTTRLEAVDSEEFRRPVFETCRVECPAPRMCESLTLGEVELGLLALLHVEVDPDPAEECSIGRPQWVAPAEKPAVGSLTATHPKAGL